MIFLIFQLLFCAILGFFNNDFGTSDERARWRRAFNRDANGMAGVCHHGECYGRIGIAIDGDGANAESLLALAGFAPKGGTKVEIATENVPNQFHDALTPSGVYHNGVRHIADALLARRACANVVHSAFGGDEQGIGGIGVEVQRAQGEGAAEAVGANNGEDAVGL